MNGGVILAGEGRKVRGRAFDDVPLAGAGVAHLRVHAVGCEGGEQLKVARYGAGLDGHYAAGGALEWGAQLCRGHHYLASQVESRSFRVVRSAPVTERFQLCFIWIQRREYSHQ